MIEDFISQLAAGDPLTIWLTLFIVVGIASGIVTGFFRARKIQPKGFKWKTFRNEAAFSLLSIAIAGPVIAYITMKLRSTGIIEMNPAPASGWVIAFEYALYFLGFDTWFYWTHRWMHNEPIYSKVHKLHHLSTSPNLLTTLSVNPLESFVNGGFVPLFTALFTVHNETMMLIGPTNIIMGLYVHSGYEFLPRWWNKSWATKWFISATFHDQHHKYFTGNFGGYTTIWDRICGTMRPKFEHDFENPKARAVKAVAVAPTAATAPVLESAEV
jgi:sterol desaturase/sphingolipid hydroxylase (fatty acid hydroxylase superfamily)